jgi:hypothetical protein
MEDNVGDEVMLRVNQEWFELGRMAVGVAPNR